LPSIGSPIALTTRPSHPADGRTAAATAVTTARHPRRTPSSGANGISRACAPENPNHLARDGATVAGLDNHARTHRHGVDRARDLDQEAAHPHDSAVDLDRVELGDLFRQCFHHASQILAEPALP
jgi:hypothetical protein